MNQQNLSSQIRAEVKAALLEYGFIGSQATAPTKLSEQEYRQVRRLAWRIIEGHIDVDEIDQLSASAKLELSRMIPQILSLRDLPVFRYLQKVNPYFEPLPSKIIKDY